MLSALEAQGDVRNKNQRLLDARFSPILGLNDNEGVGGVPRLRPQGAGWEGCC